MDCKNSGNPVKHLLIMGGGLGMLPEDTGFYHYLNSLPDIKATVITGKNTGWYEQLQGRFEHVNILGFVENIYDYMRQADLIITKPGGITTFEAIHARVPIAALNPTLLQEIYNAHYIEEMQIGAVISGSSIQCLDQIAQLIKSDKLKDYRDNIDKIKERLDKNSLPQILQDNICRSSRSGSLSDIYPNRNEGISINETISFNI